MTQSIKSLLQLYFSKGWKVVAMLSFVIMVIRIKTLYQIKIFQLVPHYGIRLH